MFIILFHLWSSISQLGTEVVTIHVLSLIVYFIAIQSQYKWTFRIEESRPWNRNRYAHTSPHYEYQPWRHQWCQDNLIHTFTAYENLDEKSYTRRWGTIKSWLSNTSGDKRHVGMLVTGQSGFMSMKKLPQTVKEWDDLWPCLLL